MSKEPLQHSPTEHISQCVNKPGEPTVILVRISNSQAMNARTALTRSVGGGSGRGHRRVRARCPCHSQGKVLPSFASAVSVWPSVLLPLSEAAEYLSDTSTCQQAPGTGSTDAGDSFFQPERAARTFSPISHVMRSHSLCSRCFHLDIPSQLTHTVPFPLLLNMPHPSWAHL